MYVVLLERKGRLNNIQTDKRQIPIDMNDDDATRRPLYNAGGIQEVEVDVYHLKSNITETKSEERVTEVEELQLVFSSF